MAKMTRAQGFSAKEIREHRISYTYAMLSFEDGEVKVHMRFVEADDLSDILVNNPGWITAWEHDMAHYGPEWCWEHDQRMRRGEQRIRIRKGGE